jgi:CRP/FNR family cyclic AMP-dependent transcriptional regulator
MGQVDGRVGWGYNKHMPEKFTKRTTFLRSLSLFEGLSERELRHLVEESRLCRFRAGEMILYQGEPGFACHILMRGRVRVFVVGEDGRELAMHILGPGEIIGEMALFDDLPRSANVEALEESQTLELHRDALLRCLRRSPALALSLLRSMSTRLRHATGDAEGLASLTVAERLVQRLQRLAEWSGMSVAGGVRIVPPMTQQELAALVGTSRESVNRALVRLRQQGKVRLDNGWIVLLNGESEHSSN